MIDMKIWLLPEPDSPTTPTASPALTVKLTPLTAFTGPSGVVKVVSRFVTSSTVFPCAARSAPRVPDLGKAVTTVIAQRSLGSKASRMPSPR